MVLQLSVTLGYRVWSRHISGVGKAGEEEKKKNQLQCLGMRYMQKDMRDKMFLGQKLAQTRRWLCPDQYHYICKEHGSVSLEHSEKSLGSEMKQESGVLNSRPWLSTPVRDKSTWVKDYFITFKCQASFKILRPDSHKQIISDQPAALQLLNTQQPEFRTPADYQITKIRTRLEPQQGDSTKTKVKRLSKHAFSLWTPISFYLQLSRCCDLPVPFAITRNYRTQIWK